MFFAKKSEQKLEKKRFLCLFFSFIGIPPTQQMLIFNGTILQDNFTLAQYNIEDKCTLMMTKVAQQQPVQPLKPYYPNPSTQQQPAPPPPHSGQNGGFGQKTNQPNFQKI